MEESLVVCHWKSNAPSPHPPCHLFIDPCGCTFESAMMRETVRDWCFGLSKKTGLCSFDVDSYTKVYVLLEHPTFSVQKREREKEHDANNGEKILPTVGTQPQSKSTHPALIPGIITESGTKSFIIAILLIR